MVKTIIQNMFWCKIFHKTVILVLNVANKWNIFRDKRENVCNLTTLVVLRGNMHESKAVTSYSVRITKHTLSRLGHCLKLFFSFFIIHYLWFLHFRHALGLVFVVSLMGRHCMVSVLSFLFPLFLRSSLSKLVVTSWFEVSFGLLLARKLRPR